MFEVSAFSDITSEVGNDYHNHHDSSLEFTSHIPRPDKVAWHTMDVQLNRFYPLCYTSFHSPAKFHALWGQQPDSVESSEPLLAIKM